MAKIDFGGVMEDGRHAGRVPAGEGAQGAQERDHRGHRLRRAGPGPGAEHARQRLQGHHRPGPEFKRDWDKAVKDGWVPGKTLFDIEEAAQGGTDHPVPGLRRRPEGASGRSSSTASSRATPSTSPTASPSSTRSRPRSSRRRTSTSSWSRPRARARACARNFLAGSGINSSYAVFQDATGRAEERTPGPRHRHRLGLPLPDHLRAGGLQRPHRRARRAHGRAGRRHGSPVRRAARSTATPRARPSTRPSRSSPRASSAWWPRTAWTGCTPTAAPRPSAARWTGSPGSRRRPCRCSRSSTSGEGRARRPRSCSRSTARPTTRRSSRRSSRSIRDSEMWQAGAAVRSLRPENWKKCRAPHERLHPLRSASDHPASGWPAWPGPAPSGGPTA